MQVCRLKFNYALRRLTQDQLTDIARQKAPNESALWALGELKQCLLSGPRLPNSWDVKSFRNTVRSLVVSLPTSEGSIGSPTNVPADIQAVISQGWARMKTRILPQHTH